MGNKLSTVNGVKSPNFFEPGNGVNEIWIGDVEIISRLPFGDSDMAQAAWHKGEYPKIPWRPFIIPLRATFDKMKRSVSVPDSETSGWWSAIEDWVAAIDWSCILFGFSVVFGVISLLIAIALWYAPFTLSCIMVVGPSIRPSIRDCEDQGAFKPRYRNQAKHLRAYLALLNLGQGYSLLWIAGVIGNPCGGSILPRDPLEGFSVVLMALGTYSSVRLSWASFRSNSTLTDDDDEGASDSAAPGFYGGSAGAEAEKDALA